MVRPADGDPATVQVIGRGYNLLKGNQVQVQILFRNRPVAGYTLINDNLLEVVLPDPDTTEGDALGVTVLRRPFQAVIASAFILVDPGAIQVYDDHEALRDVDPPTGPWPEWAELVGKAFTQE